MKKLGWLLLFLFVFPLSANAEEFMFKSSPWGAARAEIKALYADDKPVRDGDYLTYDIPAIMGMEAQINYGFTKDDELAYLSYRLYTPPSESTVHIGNYDAVKQSVNNQYGAPAYDNIYWFADKASLEAGRDAGVALFERAMRFETVWELPDANIMLEMKGQGQEVVISLGYVSENWGNKFTK